jgi:putative hydrolase of the HAD superfamily
MSASRPAVFFDLGNTLAAYYNGSEFQPILRQAIACVAEELGREGVRSVNLDSAIAAAALENREADDFRFMPMSERFSRIFGLDFETTGGLDWRLCRAFLTPIFALGRLYEDSLEALEVLRRQGFATGIVSNAPWGSPPDLWRGELARLGLSAAVDCVVLCGDVGWRKPAPEIFQFAAERLGVSCSNTTFVGDDLKWDIQGSEAVGMRAVLIDRDNRHPEYDGNRILQLRGIEELLSDV